MHDQGHQQLLLHKPSDFGMESATTKQSAASDLEDRIEADLRFHRILAEATGNPVFVLLLETLAGFLRESRQKTLAYSGVESALREHRAVFQAVRERDSEKARESMEQHLRSATRDLNELRADRAGRMSR